MLSRKLFRRFCCAQTYIDQFSSLEKDVNRLEIEVLEKKHELETIKGITELPKLHLMLKKTMEFFNQPYENIALNNEKERIKELHRQYELLQVQTKSKMEIAQKHKNEEERRREEMFLIDLARFSDLFDKTLNLHDSKCQVLTGLEISLNSLGRLLQKEQVTLLGKQGEAFDHELHQRIEGNCQKIGSVIQKGLKIKGKIVEKAKIK